jgi:protein associated with RNAse G/E
MTTIEVIKQNYKGEETWRYSGKVLKRTQSLIVLEAFFDRDEVQVEDLLLHRGDKFIEFYYTDRWYNVFEVHNPADNHIKGWYCNICHPAEFSAESLAYKDLALDLLVYPTGRQVTLDEAEFDELPISPFERDMARRSLHELQRLFRGNMITRAGWSEYYRP